MRSESGLMDEELVETDGPSVGERLRAAREEKKLSLEDVAAQTRIPRRHLESIEAADWDHLPAPTYTIGFARSYASVVGLDRAEVADQLRAEMGGQRTATASEVFEPADPARTMPRSLVIGAIVAVILLIIFMSWLNRRSLDQRDETTNNAPVAAAPAPSTAAPPPIAVAQGPVVLTATDAVWLAVKDGGNVLKQGIMQPGESFQVPATATAPMLTTAKAEALRINVGNAIVPPVGPPATKVTVSLRAADLMKTGRPAAPAAAPPAATAAPAEPPARRPAATRTPAPAPQRAAPPPTTQPAPTTNGISN
jgi:cytoskeleton protein RodZ